MTTRSTSCPLNLAAGERSVQVFEKTSAEGGRLRASIDRADALPADNTAWAILPRRARQKVILVTPGNLFLEKVFEAIPLVDLEVVKVPERRAAGSGRLARLGEVAGSAAPNARRADRRSSITRCPMCCRPAACW